MLPAVGVAAGDEADMNEEDVTGERLAVGDELAYFGTVMIVCGQQLALCNSWQCTGSARAALSSRASALYSLQILLLPANAHVSKC